MEIVKHGKFYTKRFCYECPVCGCEFVEFCNEETIMVWSEEYLEYNPVHKCPECGFAVYGNTRNVVDGWE